MKAILALGALAALLALPSATAVISTGDQYEAIAMMLDILAPGTGDVSALPILYLDDAGNVWQESNDLPGLQTEATVDEQGNETPADTLVAGLGALPLPEL